MGTWHNASGRHLTFVIDRDLYEVPNGAECALPRIHDYVPEARRLPLTRGPAPTPGAPRVEPTEAPRRAPGRLLPGIEAGKRRPTRDPDDAVDDVDNDKETPEGDGETSDDPVAAAAEKLEAQGVRLPGKRAK